MANTTDTTINSTVEGTPDSSLVANPNSISPEVAAELSAKTPPWSCILFDLDGTITDSAPGIMARISQALEQVGQPKPSEAELFAMIGPPLRDTFIHTLGMTPELADETLIIQRNIAAQLGPGSGSAVYPGVAGLIREVHAAGIPIGLATSKGELQAVEILEHFDLTDCFTAIVGASLDETRSAKADVVEEALIRLSAAGVDTSNPVMVGDRIFDINGAAAHGIPTIVVEWGYGSPEESTGALSIVHSTDQLRSRLIP
ncbi:HAD hydrolase-like protein [Lysinibacter cavernae]|uniref:Phosphoglycolate phosphatase n=1 Tax=Lysinibacter cavernae TaxID=1640652 RepID=A0A7X5R303_9MICO|nr:HAD hydrolase-like protein [Lysinibacter cavernae]NIH54718.1 phosphoglycolate phosphatase [Lysinibacter cavernae]